MKDEKYFADDRFIISDDLKKMSQKELLLEIERLEREELLKHQKLTSIAV